MNIPATRTTTATENRHKEAGLRDCHSSRRVACRCHERGQRRVLKKACKETGALRRIKGGCQEHAIGESNFYRLLQIPEENRKGHQVCPDSQTQHESSPETDREDARSAPSSVTKQRDQGNKQCQPDSRDDQHLVRLGENDRLTGRLTFSGRTERRRTPCERHPLHPRIPARSGSRQTGTTDTAERFSVRITPECDASETPPVMAIAGNTIHTYPRNHLLYFASSVQRRAATTTEARPQGYSCRPPNVIVQCRGQAGAFFVCLTGDPTPFSPPYILYPG